MYVTRIQTSQTTVRTLWDKFIVHYRLPEEILSDQGHNFQSQLATDLCKLMGMQKIWTSPYHPQTNSQCERFNYTLVNMLGMLPPQKKSEWKNHIGTLVHAYNSTRNSAKGSAPTISCMRGNPSSSGCYPWCGNYNSTRYNQIHTENEGTHQMGLKKGQSLPSKGSRVPQMQL